MKTHVQHNLPVSFVLDSRWRS